MKFKILFLTLLISALSWGQTTISAWTFPTISGAAPTTLAAECGVFSATSNFYADGTNGSSNWSAGTYFVGTAPATALCGVTADTGAYSLAAPATPFNNNFSVIFKIPTTGYQDLILNYSTRGSATGYSTHDWAYSTNGTTFTNQSTITGRNVTTFSNQTVDFSAVSALDNLTFVYIRLRVSGATGSGGNNRLDNINFTAVSAGPEINLQGGSPLATISDDATTTSTTNFTDFGNAVLGNNVQRTFRIQNTGSAPLTLSGVSPYVVISGANAGDFSVTAAPLTTTIAAGGFTPFTVRFLPTAVGLRTATLTINNNDGDEAVYNFAIQGTGASAASDIIAVPNSEPATISSTASGTTISNVTPGELVWQIKVRDGGAAADADNYATILTRFTIIAQSPGNTVTTWADAIFSVGLFDDTGFIANGTVITNQIQFTGLNINVADNEFKNLYIRLSLKCPLGLGAVDGNYFGFSITAANTTFSTTGSGKAGFSPATSSNVSANVINVVATKLVFTTQPTSTGLDNTMITVVVKAYDACNNLDTGFTGAVSLFSSGTMTAVTPITAVAGVATFSGIVHTAIGTNLTLTASSTVTNAISTFFDIVLATVFNPGELLFVGYDGQVNGSGLEDEYLIATLVDIKPKTQFSIVNSRYEAGAAANVRTNKWGGGGDIAEEVPYTTSITYNGTTNIPAGSILAITTNGSANWFGSVNVITGTTTTNSTSEFSGSLVFGTTFNPNISTTSSGQIYLIQGSFVSDGLIDSGQANYILSGTLLHGLTNAIAWVTLSTACSGLTTRESRLPASLTCFNVENSASGNISGFYQNDKQHGIASIRQIIKAVGNVASNWTLGSGRYTKDPTLSSTTRAAKTFEVGPSNPVGSWVGDVSGDSTNWFNCGNWEGLKVPDSTTDVELNSTSLSNAVIDFNATYSDNFIDIASCKNLSITAGKVQVDASSTNILEVNGNLSISASGTLDMDDGTAAADGIIKLKGNWTNSVGDAAFSEGNGTVEFVGTTPQLISSVATEGTEIFYNVVLDNNFDTGVSNDLIASGDLTIKSGRTVNIDSNGYIKAYKALNHSGDLTIQSNGQLIQVDDTDTNTGDYSGTKFTVKRAYTAKDIDYVYWSAPTKLFAVANIPSGYRYEWDPVFPNTNGTFGNWLAPSTTTMTLGKGYIARTFNGSSTPATNTFTFRGQPNNGTITVPISRGSYQGTDYPIPSNPSVTVTRWDDNWNLVGNPYPSAIKALTFLSVNPDIEGFVYLWSHNTAPSTAITDPFYSDFLSNYTSADYIIYNASGMVSGPTGFNGMIASGQGFFVLMKDGAAGNGLVNFNNSMRRNTTTNASYDNTQFYKNSTVEQTVIGEEEKSRIWLDIVSPQNAVKRTLIGYIETASNEKDRMFDAVTKPNSLDIYSFIDNDAAQEYSIQGRALPFSNSDFVALGIKVGVAGNYKIAISAVDGLFELGQPIFLEDKLLNIIHDLRQSPYSFDAGAGIFNDRFVLRYTNATLDNPNFETLNNSVVVSANHGEFKIKSFIENIQEVIVYDILGRQLFEAKGINNTEFMASTISMSQQTLIVKIKLENGVSISRKIIL